MTEATTPTPNPTPLWLIVRLLNLRIKTRTARTFSLLGLPLPQRCCVSVLFLVQNMFVTYNNDRTTVMSEHNYNLLVRNPPFDRECPH